MKTFTSIFDLGKILDPRKSTSTAWYLEVRKIGGQAVLNKAYVINTLPFVTFKCIIFIYTTVIWPLCFRSWIKTGFIIQQNAKYNVSH